MSHIPRDDLNTQTPEQSTGSAPPSATPDLSKDQDGQTEQEVARRAQDDGLAPEQTGNDDEKPGLLTPSGSLKGRPQTLLQGRATTSLSLAGVGQAADADRSPASDLPHSRSTSRRPSVAGTPRQLAKAYGDLDDNASVRSLTSHAPTLPSGEFESLIDAVLRQGNGEGEELLSSAATDEDEEAVYARVQEEEQAFASQFESEFVEIESLRESGNTEEALTLAWSLKLKHFMILSSAGKPIWSRHGDDQLITGTIGVIQTIISFYQDEEDSLRSFTAGDARFAVLSKGHLHLVAVSRMGENDMQLRAQLEALYMQILSTLTLPNLEKMFVNRPSMDLRRPLQGTETLLSALADGFARGSPSTLLSSLESLRLRKAQRNAISNVLVKARTPGLLYGLLVTGTGQLISVLRPKKHSLHPGDLHLVFNMLFEAKGVRAGGGENWVPLCLPGFNNKGYVYMYVSFLDLSTILNDPAPSSTASAPQPDPHEPSKPAKSGSATTTPTPQSQHDRAATPSTELAIILISAQKEAFFELRGMRDAVVTALGSSSHVAALSAALLHARPSLATLLPGTPLQHFLYKSRAHVQFTHPSAHPHFGAPLAWRRLMSRYAALHAAVHARAGRNKVVWSVERDGSGAGVVGVAWVQPAFELYAVAGARTTKAAVAKALADVVAWARREEQRLFVVGGAVF